MSLTVRLTPGQLKEKAVKYGLSDGAFEKLTIHDFGNGTITVTAHDKVGEDFLKNLDVNFAIRKD